MQVYENFVDQLQIDLTSRILGLLDDSADLSRACAVSHSWRHFVIANGLCKRLCVEKVPQLASIACLAEEDDGILKLFDVLSKYPVNFETLEKEHQIYTSVLQVMAKPMIHPRECIAFPVSASSTDRNPAENIINTLVPTDRYPWGGSYWSSTGQSDPNVPENLLYRLKARVSIVTEINIRPFEVFWEPGSPVYSAKSVRFRMGYPKLLKDLETDVRLSPEEQPSVDDFVWTYTSQEFPMAKEACLQQFKLPEPALCIGGFVRIELLGRTQTEYIDGLYYICIGHVKVLGRSLEPAFNLEMFPSGELLLKYCPDAMTSVLDSFSDSRELYPCGASMARLRRVRELLPLALAHEIVDFDLVQDDLV